MRALLVLMCVLAASCAGTPETPPAPGVPDFAVVSGPDGVALVGADWVEQVPELAGSDIGRTGALAVGLTATSAAVLAEGRIAVVRPHQPAVVADCADCSGIAATSVFIVTSRKNFTPGNGIDIVLFNHDLTPRQTVATQRLEERATTGYPAENTESPVTLAASADRITLGYLARSGGTRRGPSVLAQYSLDGRLLQHVMVDGILRHSAVSADGRRLAVGVGGSGGACITVAAPVVVELDSLRAREFEPEVPGELTGSSPWFMLTDLQWRGDVLTATGEVHDPPAGETCDPQPEVWRREFDAAQGTSRDSGGREATALRSVGPGCAVVEVVGSWDSAELRRGAERLGAYHQMSLGRADCT